ncbi:MAG: ATP-binding protein [Pyrinomonadaceae bacterium]|nr:ATP-binding protein [Acidobacteriota bacterium]MBK7933334.1 ATP-binding protein [Acidobacteriota bacterium]MBP7375293.1 ATP-binding protein [Pyrinomonadaceae bacterium]
MQRRILIIDDHDDLATSLEEVFSHIGHEVAIVEDRSAAIRLPDVESYDMVITDLDVESTDPVAQLNGDEPTCFPKVAAANPYERIKAFKLCAANFRRDDFDEDELKNMVATVLDYKIRYVDTAETVQDLHENIEFELPSAISLMHIVLEYLMKRVEKLGVVKPEQSNLFVALDEAFVNAVKHGNKFDAKKLVRITAEVSKQEAKFTIEDEGEGFDVNNIPDPLDPTNLFKTSGRGVLFIYNIMDEVKYNDRGNRLTMIKRSEQSTAT